jgi:CheY-like chemotaxis protein
VSFSSAWSCHEDVVYSEVEGRRATYFTLMREILLVEDLDSDAALVLRGFRRLRIANPVRHLRDGLEALTFLSNAEKTAAQGTPLPAVLLLDLKLPGMTGFDILERIRERPGLRGILRIVLSQIDDTRRMRRAYDLGADSYLLKPFREDDLLELIAAFPGYWKFTEMVPSAANKPAMAASAPVPSTLSRTE